MEDRLVVVHDKGNGRWELQGSMKSDELGNMGCLVPMKYEVHYEHEPHFLKTTYYYKAILNLKN